MKLDLKTTGLDQLFVDLEKQSLRVGILNKTLKSEPADYNKPHTIKSDPDTGQTYENNQIKFGTKYKKITVAKLAMILDAEHGVISDVIVNADNKDLVKIIELFAIPEKTEDIRKQLRNAGKSLVKNPIIRRDYGNNSIGSIMVKGFNRVAMDTGRFFRTIQAEYKEK